LLREHLEARPGVAERPRRQLDLLGREGRNDGRFGGHVASVALSRARSRRCCLSRKSSGAIDVARSQPGAVTGPEERAWWPAPGSEASCQEAPWPLRRRPDRTSPLAMRTG